MKIDSIQLLEEFYDEHAHLFPGITLDHIKEICYTPYRYAVKEMESGSLNPIRFKYLGVLRVYEGKAIKELSLIKKRFDEHKINSTQYFKFKKMLEIYIEKCQRKKA